MQRRRMFAGPLLAMFLSAFWFAPSHAAEEFSTNTKTAVVMIANFDAHGDFTGWGTGFFVDERIIVTNKHVIEGGTYYRVYATGADDKINLECFRNLTRSDVKINLEDDVAYVRASLPCDHGSILFAGADPEVGDRISVLGYPYRGSLEASLPQTRATGSVTDEGEGPWMSTDAVVDVGNSGGPVVRNDRVVGVVVAKRVGTDGKYLAGLFVPVTQVIRGLEYANDSTFGYRPQPRQASTSSRSPQQSGPATAADCKILLGDGGEAADDGGCRCTAGFQRDFTGMMCIGPRTSSSSSSRSSPSSSVRRSSSSSSVSRPSSSGAAGTAADRSFQSRTCARVRKWFTGNQKMLDRVNARLQKRFGFVCGT